MKLAARHWKTVEVAAIAAVAIGLVGLITGVRETERSSPRLVAAAAPSPASLEARSYRDMRARDYGPNRDLPPVWFGMIGRGDDLLAPVEQSAADRQRALDTRDARRAYEGAPPTVPHAVDQLGVPACLTCHDRGAKIAGLVAPVMSHARRDSCLQCHVVARDPRGVRPEQTPPAPETVFVGARVPRAERAWTGAPPTIPHTTWMRERCDSCHGLRGALGIRSTHPWRSSCQQCHAPSAVLDQRAPAALAPAGAIP